MASLRAPCFTLADTAHRDGPGRNPTRSQAPAWERACPRSSASPRSADAQPLPCSRVGPRIVERSLRCVPSGGLTAVCLAPLGSSPPPWSNGCPCSPPPRAATLSCARSSTAREHKRLAIYAWVILDNHLHAILAAPDLSAVLRDLKSFTAKQLLQQIKLERREWLLHQLRHYRAAHKPNEYQLWQEGSHP